MSNGKGSAPRNLGPKFRANYDAIFRKPIGHKKHKKRKSPLTVAPR